jgi:hypothetical protein
MQAVALCKRKEGLWIMFANLFRYSYKELSELAGYTHRVFNLINVMEALSMDKFSPTQGSTSTTGFSVDNIKGDFVYGGDGTIICIGYEMDIKSSRYHFRSCAHYYTIWRHRSCERFELLR